MKPSLSSMLVSLFGVGLLSAALAVFGCSGDSSAGAGAGAKPAAGAAGGGKDGGAEGGGGAALDLDGGRGGDGALTADTACVATAARATLIKRPVDIIFAVDNSSSMTDEIVSIQKNINESFASIIAASGIDYRVIMLAQHGDAAADQSICVGAPLSGTSCDPVPPRPVNNPPRFYHYSYPNESHNSLCNILDTYNGIVPDEYGLAPHGWSEWLRPDSLKVFVEITDDNVGCQPTVFPWNPYIADYDNQERGEGAAAQFESLLFSLQPAYFGDANARNYIFYSIIGLADNAPATSPWQPGDPYVFGTCSTAVAPGIGYQVLSKMTGGLRFPLCEFGSYDAVFRSIAGGVITGAVVACNFEVPSDPQGETIDLSTIVVQYTPSGAGAPQRFTQVSGLDACKPRSFYIDGKSIKLCPDTCSAVQSDTAAKIDVLYGCAPDVQ